MNNKSTEKFLMEKLCKIFKDDEKALKTFTLLATKQNKEEMLAFLENIKIQRPSQVEAMTFLITKNKTEKDELLIKKLFEIWYNSEFVLGCYVPLNEEQKEYIMTYIENKKDLPKDELINRIMYLVIKFRKNL